MFLLRCVQRKDDRTVKQSSDDAFVAERKFLQEKYEAARVERSRDRKERRK